jgi:two-component sensor histidine kinase
LKTAITGQVSTWWRPDGAAGSSWGANGGGTVTIGLDTGVIVEATPLAPRRVRRWLTEVLGSRIPPMRLQDLLVVVSELTSNSVVHTATPLIWVRLSGAAGRLRLEVWDEGPGIAPSIPQVIAGGRVSGLAMVQKLALRVSRLREHSRHGVAVVMRAA